MTDRSFRSHRPSPVPSGRLLLAGAATLVLAALPVSASPDAPAFQWQSALARGGPGGAGPGGVGDRGAHGRGIADRARGYRGPEGAGGDGPGHAGQGGYHDAKEFVDSVRSGRAFGLAQRDERVAAARERYQGALELADRGRRAGSLDDVGPPAHHFSPEEARALMARGWTGPTRDDGFRNHGERVRTMVEISKRLGYGAHVGALQANFGTPYENDIAALEAELADARAAGDEAEVERLEAELAAAVDAAKPGAGPDDSWATADLDVNGDGVVDGRDLEALEQSEADAGGDDESTG